MATQVIAVPGEGNVEFPASMSDEQIASAIKTHLANTAPPVKPTSALGTIQGMMSADIGENSRLPTPPGQLPRIAFSNSMGTPIAQGIEAMAQGTAPDIARGASKVIRGAGEAIAPIAIPIGLAAAPAATVMGMAGGGISAAGASAGLHALGAQAPYADLGSDVAGLLGGAAAGWLGGKVADLGPMAKAILNDPEARTAALEMLPKGHQAAVFIKRAGIVLDAAKAQQPAPNSELLDELAQWSSKKPFAKLDPTDQAKIRSMADRMQQPTQDPAAPYVPQTPPIYYKPQPFGPQAPTPQVEIPSTVQSLPGQPEAKIATPPGVRQESPSGQQGGILSQPEVQNRESLVNRAEQLARKAGITEKDFETPEGIAKIQKLAPVEGISVNQAGGYDSFSPETLDALQARFTKGTPGKPASEVASGPQDLMDLLQKSLDAQKKKKSLSEAMK